MPPFDKNNRREQSRKPIRTAMGKQQLLSELSQRTELPQRSVDAVLEELQNIIAAHLGDGGAGQFTLPGMLKIITQEKPATAARKGINPFTGKETLFAAKPAQTVVKVRPLKKLKEMAAAPR